MSEATRGVEGESGVHVETDLQGEIPPELPWSVYDALDCDWAAHTTVLGRWKQGDLVHGIPVSWVTVPGVDPITGAENPHTDPRPAYDENTNGSAIICSQTCDLGGTPPGDLHPFILLAPLVNIASIPPANQKLAQQDKIGYLVKTLPPHDLPQVVDEDAESATSRTRSPNVWFADLRLIFPASKALLLVREPIPGFSTEHDSFRFAETIAQKFRRIALDSTLSEDLPQALKKFVRDNGHSKQAFAKVEQVRLLVQGDHLHPTRASLFVLTDGINLSEEEREVWSRFQRVAAKVMSARGIQLAPMIHADVNTVSAAKYRETVPVRCELLGKSISWP